MTSVMRGAMPISNLYDTTEPVQIVFGQWMSLCYGFPAHSSRVR